MLLKNKLKITQNKNNFLAIFIERTKKTNKFSQIKQRKWSGSLLIDKILQVIQTEKLRHNIFKFCNKMSEKKPPGFEATISTNLLIDRLCISGVYYLFYGG